MTNEKAIDELMNFRGWLEKSAFRDALDMAIAALRGDAKAQLSGEDATSQPDQAVGR